MGRPKKNPDPAPAPKATRKVTANDAASEQVLEKTNELADREMELNAREISVANHAKANDLRSEELDNTAEQLLAREEALLRREESVQRAADELKRKTEDLGRRREAMKDAPSKESPLKPVHGKVRFYCTRSGLLRIGVPVKFTKGKKILLTRTQATHAELHGYGKAID